MNVRKEKARSPIAPKEVAFADEIRKTGFVLENQIAQQLKSAGWTVISNKYYVDDAEETVREIDLIAYKCTKVQHFSVYTAMIISCKKSEANVWALLSRQINLKDPNSNWQPLHTWSNDKVLNYQLSESEMSSKYHKRASELGVEEALQDPIVEVFAYQEMDKVSGKSQNDKAIFSAITSLMKAQAYELAALPGRKKSPCIYQFNLLSVVETDLVRLMFTGENIVSSNIETEHYLAGYIVRKRETFSRIRIIQAKVFESVLKDYGRLHLANCKWYAEEIDAFYTDLLQDKNRTKVFEEDFKNRIRFLVAACLNRSYSENIPITLFWRVDKKQVEIEVDCEFNEVATLNADEKLNSRAAKALKEIYRYDGTFVFAVGLPF